MTRPARLKALSLLLILSLLLFSLSACKQRSPEYKTVRENGKVYVNAGKYTYIPVPHTCILLSPPEFYFESFDEMYDDLKHGHFSENEMYAIGRLTKDNDTGLAEIVDFENLYKPDLPQGYAIERMKWQGGDGYRVDLTADSGITLSFSVISDEAYNEHYNRFSKTRNLNGIGRVFKETDPDTGRITYLFGQGEPCFRAVFYPLPQDEGTAYVYETYNLTVSDSIPETITVIADLGGVCYSYTFEDLKTPLSADQLQQFGVKKHIPIAFYAEGILPILLIIAAVVLIILLNKRMKRAAEAAAQAGDSDKKPLRKVDHLFCQLNNIREKVKNMIKNNRKLILRFIIIWLCFALFLVILNYALLAQPLVDDLFAPARLIPTPRFLAEMVENKMSMEDVFRIIGYPDGKSLTNSSTLLYWDLMDGNILTLHVSNGTARQVQIVDYCPNYRWMLLPAILLTFASAEVVPYLILRKKITRSTTADPQE